MWHIKKVLIYDTLTSAEIEAIDTFVDGDDDYFLLNDNCVTFSQSVWNLGGNMTYSGYTLPGTFKSAIKDYWQHEVEEYISYNSNIAFTVNGTFTTTSNFE